MSEVTLHLSRDEEGEEDHAHGVGDRAVKRVEHLGGEELVVWLVARPVHPRRNLVLLKIVKEN